MKGPPLIAFCFRWHPSPNLSGGMTLESHGKQVEAPFRCSRHPRGTIARASFRLRPLKSYGGVEKEARPVSEDEVEWLQAGRFSLSTATWGF